MTPTNIEKNLKMEKINKEVLANALSYTEYRELTDRLVAENKTTGPNQSEAMLHYTKMNGVRMKRLDKTTKLTDDSINLLSQIDQPQTWLVLTEAWCGDAAQVLPVMNKFAAANTNIDLKLIMRDEHLDIMDAYLTNGARSIPKLIVIDQQSEEVVSTWGPRPAEVQKMVMDAKVESKKIENDEERKAFNDEVKVDVQRWYTKDKTIKIQQELLDAVLSKQFA